MNPSTSTIMRDLPPVSETSSPISAELPGIDSFGVSPAIQRSQDAFRAALPGLLATKTDNHQWVAFCGDQLVTFGRTKTEAFQECLRRGLQRGTFVVRSIEPEVPKEGEILFDS